MQIFPTSVSTIKQQCILFLMLTLHFFANPVLAQESYISNTETTGYFPLVSATGIADIFVDPEDH